MSVKKNIIKNGIASALQKGIRMLDQLLLVPFFITTWGAAYYGEWITLTIIPTILGLSDLGFGTAAANTFVLRYAAGDKQGAANVAKSGIAISWLLIGVGVILSVVSLYILDFFHVFDKSLINKHDAIWAISILMLARLLAFLQQIYEAYFRAVRQAALSINLLSINSGLCLIVSVIVLLLGGNVIDFAIANLISTVVFLVIYIVTAVRIMPILCFRIGRLNKVDLIYIFNKGIGYLMTPVWQAIYFQGSTFVVRLVLGPEAVAVFNTVRTATRSVNQIFNLITGSIISELQFEIGAGNLEKARKIFRISLGLVVVIALLGVLVLLFAGPLLYELWTRKALMPPTVMWNIFIVGIFFNAVWWVSAVVFQATNRPYDFAFAGVLSALLSLICSYFFSQIWGLTGAALGSLIMDLLLFVYVLPRSCMLVNQKLNILINDVYIDIVGFINKELNRRKYV